MFPKVARVAGLGIVKLAQHLRPPDLSGGDRDQPPDRARQLGSHHHQPAVRPRRLAWRARRSSLPADADDATLELARRAVEEALNAATARAYEIADGRRRWRHVADRPPLTLQGYRLLTASAVPLARSLFLTYRLKRGKEHAERLPERRGESAIARPEGPLVWLHGASVGEMPVRSCR